MEDWKIHYLLLLTYYYIAWGCGMQSIITFPPSIPGDKKKKEGGVWHDKEMDSLSPLTNWKHSTIFLSENRCHIQETQCLKKKPTKLHNTFIKYGSRTVHATKCLFLPLPDDLILFDFAGDDGIGKSFSATYHYWQKLARISWTRFLCPTALAEGRTSMVAVASRSFIFSIKELSKLILYLNHCGFWIAVHLLCWAKATSFSDAKKVRISEDICDFFESQTVFVLYQKFRWLTIDC